MFINSGAVGRYIFEYGVDVEVLSFCVCVACVSVCVACVSVCIACVSVCVACAFRQPKCEYLFTVCVIYLIIKLQFVIYLILGFRLKLHFKRPQKGYHMFCVYIRPVLCCKLHSFVTQ